MLAAAAPRSFFARHCSTLSDCDRLICPLRTRTHTHNGTSRTGKWKTFIIIINIGPHVLRDCRCARRARNQIATDQCASSTEWRLCDHRRLRVTAWARAYWCRRARAAHTARQWEFRRARATSKWGAAPPRHRCRQPWKWAPWFIKKHQWEIDEMFFFFYKKKRTREITHDWGKWRCQVQIRWLTLRAFGVVCVLPLSLFDFSLASSAIFIWRGAIGIDFNASFNEKFNFFFFFLKFSFLPFYFYFDLLFIWK